MCTQRKAAGRPCSQVKESVMQAVHMAHVTHVFGQAGPVHEEGFEERAI